MERAASVRLYPATKMSQNQVLPALKARPQERKFFPSFRREAGLTDQGLFRASCAPPKGGSMTLRLQDFLLLTAPKYKHLSSVQKKAQKNHNQRHPSFQSPAP